MKVYIYKLTDAAGNETFAATEDVGNNIRLGGYDTIGNYQQFDSQEAYHAYEWSEKYGMKLEVAVMDIDTDKLFE